MKALPVTKPAMKTPAMPKKPVVRKAHTKTVKSVASEPTKKIINKWRAF
jgi:hypothetical protein